jgi:hypothetical protein
MDQAPLVDSDIEIEAKVVSALSHAKIPVTAVDWNWAPQLNGWQLIVVSRWVDTRGPREVYSRMLEALSDAGAYQSIPIRRLGVKSPADPVAQQLIDELKRISEGAIHIVRNRTRNATSQYTLVFAPYIGSGGPIPSKTVMGNDELRAFLEKQLGIRQYIVDRALTELEQTDSATVFNVPLSLRRARKLNLAA